MTHDPNPDQRPFGRDYWEDRYSSAGLAWSGEPNPVLVTEASPLPPGRALDIGSGEGGDAIWLAGRGWQVTGVDISAAALAKARGRVEALDRGAASRIEWVQRDLTVWAPDPASFDLVSSQFMHLPEPFRSALFRALAAAVAPGGTLLVVGHDVSDGVEGHSAHFAELMFGVDDVLAAIDGEGLRVETAEVRERGASHGTSADSSHHRDVVVRAARPAHQL